MEDMSFILSLKLIGFGSLQGDIHFDEDETWGVDGATGQFIFIEPV
jgi:hypothetical protein